MAIAYLAIEAPINRRQGKGVVAAAAYRAGECLTDHETGEIKDYSQKAVISNGIALPPGVDTKWHDREALWNHAQERDRRSNSILARNVIAALPHELVDDPQAYERIMIRWCEHLAAEHGVAADWSIHPPDNPKSSDLNFHGHVIFTSRRLTSDGLTEKTRELDKRHGGKEAVEKLRQKWGEIVNAELAAAGLSERIDMRSYKRQGVNMRGGAHLGPGATALERRGLPTAAGRADRRAAFYNRQQAAIAEYSDRIRKTGRTITAATLSDDLAAAGLAVRRVEKGGRKWREIYDPARPKAMAVPVGKLPIVSDALKAEREQQQEARRQQQAQAQQRQQAAATAQKAGRAAKRLMQSSDSAADEARAGFQAGQAAAEAAAAIVGAFGRWGQQRASQQAAQVVQQAAARRPAVGETTETGAKRLGLGQPKTGRQPQAMEPGAMAARQRQREQKGR